MFVRMFAMRLKARAVTTKIDTNSHKSAVDHRERETSSLSYQKALLIFQRGFDSRGQHTTEREMGDESPTPLVMKFIKASEVVIPVHQARSRDEFRSPDLNFTVWSPTALSS